MKITKTIDALDMLDDYFADKDLCYDEKEAIEFIRIALSFAYGLAYDYNGYESSEDLKGLIDEIIELMSYGPKFEEGKTL